MRICLLTDSYPAGDPRLPHDEAPCDPRPYLPEADWRWVTLGKVTAVQTLTALAREGFDLFFNLCDGAWDEPRPGIEVVQTLERLGVPFTGATSQFYEPSREAMKRVCAARGIDTPGYVIARDDAAVERAADTLRFPLIVKHPSSYGSVGITRASRVETHADLQTQAGQTMHAYGGALIEEFIEGREATVLVAENPSDPRHPTTYRPVEYSFPEGESFKHYDLKWVDYHGLRAHPVTDPDVESRLRDAAARMFVGLRGSGYGRCDLRIDRDGRAFMLEINPNCGIYFPESDPGSADLCLMHDPAGHRGFTQQVVAAAIERARGRRRAWEVRPTAGNGYGLFATRPIRRGERIIGFEESPHVLVSRSHVERDWDELQQSWFERYAWPLTEEIWVIWDDDPENWRPINHACEPSAWLDGLDLVSRSDIEQGEEISMDYATLYTEVMPAFECACGATNCRGMIRGDDHLQDFVARYGSHVSEFVRQRRENGRALAGGPMDRAGQRSGR